MNMFGLRQKTGRKRRPRQGSGEAGRTSKADQSKQVSSPSAPASPALRTPAGKDLMSDPRRAIILACLKEEMVFRDEQGTLVAGKGEGGAEYRREIGPIDDAVKMLLEMFNISLVPDKIEMMWLGLDSEEKKRGVPLPERIATFLVGTTGCGKSTLLLDFMLQDLEAGRGFCLLDAHGDLAEMILSYIPPERWKDVVYINPQTAWTNHKVVQFNFLEKMHGVGTSIVDRAFMDSLEKIYKEFWGPRLEQIMLNALLAIREANSGDVTLHDLSAFLGDPDEQREFMKRVEDKEVERFWRFVFPSMPDYAESAVETKLFRVLQEPMLVPVFEAKRSTVNFRELIDTNKIVIINLPEGALTSSVTNFLGSMLLSRIYLAGMSREDTAEGERVPFAVYIDESARFMTTTLVELLQAMRKYKIFVTLAVQDLLQYESKKGSPDLREVVPGLCNTICVFACGEKTARVLEGYFKGENFNYMNLMKTPLHRFYATSRYWNEIHRALFTTIVPPSFDAEGKEIPRKQGINNLVPHGRYNPEEVIKASIEHYGVDYIPKEERPRGVLARAELFPPFDPVVMFALAKVSERPGIGKEEVIKWLQEQYRLDTSAAGYGLRTIIQRNFVTEGAEFHDAAERGTKRPYYYYNMTEAGWQTLYPPLKGPRCGGTTHTAILGKVMRDCWKKRVEMSVQTSGMMGKEAEEASVDLAKRVTITYQGVVKEKSIEFLPDLLVYSPLRTVTQGGMVKYDPFGWDKRERYAVEVEADPVRHVERMLAHFARMKELKLPVVFAVSDERFKEYVTRVLTENGAKIVKDINDGLFPGYAEVRLVDPTLDDDHIQKQYKESEATASPQGLPEDTEDETLPPASTGEALSTETHKECETPPPDEPKPPAEKDLTVQRGSDILTCLKEGLVFWKEGDTLFAGKGEGGMVSKREMGPFDDATRKFIQLFNIPLKFPSAPAEEDTSSDPRRGKITGYQKEGGWTFWSEKVRDITYLYAGKIVDGGLEKKEIGFFDDVCKIIVAELGVSVGPAPPPIPPLPSLPSSEDQGHAGTKIKEVEAKIKELDERANHLKQAVRNHSVPNFDERLASIEQDRRQLEKELEQLKSAPATHEKESPTPPPTPLAESTAQEKKISAKEEKTQSRQRKLPTKLDFNTIRSRVSKWNKKGYYFIERQDWVHACKWDKDTQKMDDQSIGSYDDRMKKLLKRMKISLRQ